MQLLTEEQALKHYGVIGMKWGVRRNRRVQRAHERDAANLRKHGFKTLAKVHEDMASERKAKADKLEAELNSAQKARRKADQRKNRKRVKEVNDLIDNLVQQGVDAAAKRGKKWDADKDRKYWNNFFKSELNIKEMNKRSANIRATAGKIEDAIVWLTA